MTYSIHMMEDLLRKRFKNRASVRSVDVRSTDLMEILDIIYKIRYMRRAAMKQARQTAKGVVVSLTEFVQSGSHPGDAVFDAIADMHRDITGKEWKNGAERPRVDGNLRSEVAVQYDAAYVKKLEAQIAHLREERTAFIDAANALAGTTGFAWTAALAVASGRAEKVEVRLKAAIDEHDKESISYYEEWCKLAQTSAQRGRDLRAATARAEKAEAQLLLVASERDTAVARAEKAERDLAVVDMILNVVGADSEFRASLLRSMKARIATAAKQPQG